MLKKLLKILKPRKYTTSEQRKLFENSPKIIRKEVKEEIRKAMKSNSKLHNIEKKQRIELEVLVDILKENPNYYTESEFNELYHEITHDFSF
ncbi:hypothetical protein ATE84_3821 [Aquimarina sp. MAR_2010_214]|uniref:hypothetical protein n=1 Tax=Aquimarina sp. MAR_2010_214 TaxID=1250026 RepID=UPI000C70F3E9|nr:hypothetical protein [Aquimarina sp. MAR_2010_214]PKV51723.1 hypothetical protein ATE84_3821 [Aquimarina sp. MAR_2010_214]